MLMGIHDSRELRAAAVGAAVLATYTAMVLASGKVSVADFMSMAGLYLDGAFNLWLAVALLFVVIKLYLERPKRAGTAPGPIAMLAAVARERWERDRFVSLLWPPILFALLMVSFNAFKQMDLPLAGYWFDPIAANVDRTIFFGFDAWQVTHGLFASPAATLAFGTAYHGWFVPMSLGVILCAWMPRHTFHVRTQYLLSYLAVWIVIGSILAFLLPSAGPCYYTRLVAPAPDFDALTRQLLHDQQAGGSPLIALRIQAMLFKYRSAAHLEVGGGISAMPSVHVALAVLFALAGFRLNRLLGWVLALYAIVILIASVDLGWHYAIDGVVATGVTFAIWHACGRIAEWLDDPYGARSARPALA
jgi:hypothetical protein